MTTDNPGPVEVTVTDDQTTSLPNKKRSLGRSHRIGGVRAPGLQRHIKRESMQQGESSPVTGDVESPDKRRASEVGRYAVTLKDGPVKQ